MFRASLCPSSGDTLYKTASDVSLDALAAVVWIQGSALSSCPDSTQPQPAIQANTTRGFIQSVLLTMGIMMPETY